MLIIFSSLGIIGLLFLFLIFFNTNKVTPRPSPDWEQQNLNDNITQSSNPMNTPTKVASVDSLVDGLRQRLEAEPNDVKGWVLLSKSYHLLERWDDAKYAMDKAKALGYEGEAKPLNDNNNLMPNDDIHKTVSDKNMIQQSTAGDQLLIKHIENIQ